MSVTGTKSTCQELEAAGHEASTVRRQRVMGASIQPLFLYDTVQDPRESTVEIMSCLRMLTEAGSDLPWTFSEACPGDPRFWQQVHNSITVGHT